MLFLELLLFWPHRYPTSSRGHSLRPCFTWHSEGCVMERTRDLLREQRERHGLIPLSCTAQPTRCLQCSVLPEGLHALWLLQIPVMLGFCWKDPGGNCSCFNGRWVSWWHPPGLENCVLVLPKSASRTLNVAFCSVYLNEASLVLNVTSV